MPLISDQLKSLKALLDVPHPVSGAWAVDDAAAANQANAKDMEAEPTQETLYLYLANEIHIGSSLLGRLGVLAGSDVGPDSNVVTVNMGTQGTPNNITVTQQVKSACFTLITIVSESGVIPNRAAMSNLLDKIDAGDVMSNPQKNAILAFYDNRASLMTVNGLPKVKPGDITEARAQP